MTKRIHYRRKQAGLSHEQKHAEIIRRLTEAGIPHHFIAGDVHCPSENIEWVEDLLAEIHGADAGAVRPMTEDNRLFIGLMPACVVYCDRYVEVDRDYKHLARLFYDTLELKIEPDCPAALRIRIIADATGIQAKRGTLYGGHLLGGSLSRA